MMLIVVSDARIFKEEAAFINAIFDEGLQLFHLRKPEAEPDEVKALLDEIDSTHLSKIALHQHHSLARTFGIRRLHYPEWKRKNSRVEDRQRRKEEGCHLSTSVHQLNEEINSAFEYAFFGPVFNSISKKGYRAIPISKSEQPNKKLIAIGGIDENNCTKAIEMGFGGVAVLGAIWQSSEPLKQFKKIQSKCNSIVHLS